MNRDELVVPGVAAYDTSVLSFGSNVMTRIVVERRLTAEGVLQLNLPLVLCQTSNLG
jgi:hypothetical protein